MNENTPTPEEAGAATSSVTKFQRKDSKNMRHEQIAELIFLLPVKKAPIIENNKHFTYK